MVCDLVLNFALTHNYKERERKTKRVRRERCQRHFLKLAPAEQYFAFTSAPSKMQTRTHTKLSGRKRHLGAGLAPERFIKRSAALVISAPPQLRDRDEAGMGNKIETTITHDTRSKLCSFQDFV
jgi:hypothetical protein